MTVQTRIALAGARWARATKPNAAAPVDVAVACSRAGRRDLSAGLMARGATMEEVHAALATAPAVSPAPLHRRPVPLAAAPAVGAPAPTPPAQTIDARAILARHGEMRAARAAALPGARGPAMRKPLEPSRQAPPASCNAIDTQAVYARLNQQLSGRR